MKDNLAPRTMVDLLKHKQKLLKQRATCPEMAADLDANLTDLERKINASIAKSDNKFCNNFYKISRETLPPEVLAKLEQIAATRTQQHRG